MQALAPSKFMNLRRSFSTYKKVLTRDSIGDNVLKAEYAVRGKIPLRGEEL